MESLSRILLTFLLNALWQIPVVALIAILAGRLMRNGPASHRHAVFVAALIASVILPMASVRTSRPPASMTVSVAYTPPTGGIAAAPSSEPAATRRGQETPEPRTVSLPRIFAGAVLWAYLIFLLVRCAMLIRALVQTARVRKLAERLTPPPEMQAVWERCRGVFRTGSVELLSSPHVAGPVTLGIRRRTIVLPEELVGECRVDVLSTAIGHEMAHIARWDFPASLLYELLYLPVSFHPAGRVIYREIGRTREMACDELVAGRLMDANVYARSIVDIAARMSGLGNAGYSLGVFDGNILEERIRRLLAGPIANMRRWRLLLAAGLGSLALCVISVSGLALSARAQGGVQNELKIAESAFNSGDFATAVQHFDHAVKLDPANLKARLFLAYALLSESYAQKPGPDSPLLGQARQQYLDVLAADPGNRAAMQGIVSIAMQTQHPREAHEFALKLAQSAPDDKTGPYLVGVLDWATVYPELQRAKQSTGGKPQDYFISDAMVRKNLREQYEPVVDEGMTMLERALKTDPAYSDAMAYLNLMYRLKASLVDSPAESATLIATADGWVGKALAVRKQHLTTVPDKPAPLDVDGPAPGPANARLMVAPPPPPPPPPGRVPPGAQQPASALPPASPRTAEPPGRFWQVTGPESGTPALVVFQRLREKGFPVMLAAMDDQVVRVMVGPYFDSASLEKAKPELEKAGYRPLRVW